MCKVVIFLNVETWKNRFPPLLTTSLQLLLHFKMIEVIFMVKSLLTKRGNFKSLYLWKQLKISNLGKINYPFLSTLYRVFSWGSLYIQKCIYLICYYLEKMLLYSTGCLKVESMFLDFLRGFSSIKWRMSPSVTLKQS